jgi:integrase
LVNAPFLIEFVFRQFDCGDIIIGHLVRGKFGFADAEFPDVGPTGRGLTQSRRSQQDRAEKIWSVDQIKSFCAVASTELQAALLLALWTGQRQGDLLRLSWANYDGTHLRLRQNKGKKRVTIPVGQPLTAPFIC